MSFAPTTQRALEGLIIGGLHEVTPTLEADRGWKHNADPEDVSVSLALRQFHLEWGEIEQVIGGATGNLDYEVEARLDIVTHYGDLPIDRVGEVIGMDHFDVNRYFGDRLETIVGLTNWTSAGVRARDPDARVYEHSFDVAYLRR